MSAYFELVSRSGKPITTIDDWFCELNKREQKKFVPGYSAYETARAWTEPNRIPEATAALFELPPLEGFKLERAVVEAKTWFDKFGGPRHHDLLLTARSEEGHAAVVGVESKVNEDRPREGDVWCPPCAPHGAGRHCGLQFRPS
jgi:hypothetical protein